MRLIETMSEQIRERIRTWLRIQPATGGIVNIHEALDFNGNAIKNGMWYRGESEELSQLYTQLDGDRTRFWAAGATVGMEIRKLHVGIPALMADLMGSIVVADMNDVDAGVRQQEWDEVTKENDFRELMKDAVTETLYIGDGAFKISFDMTLSKEPIIEFYPGDRIEFRYNRSRVREIIFRTSYFMKNQEYVLYETYGKGYIHYDLTKDGRSCSMELLPETAGLKDVSWKGDFMMAFPVMFDKSPKYEGRGKSIYDGRIDNFDAVDEAWSQWMDALRRNRTKEYIPENMLPRNPTTGEILAPNPFDHAYIKTDAPMTENASNKIELVQGNIPHESYLATYITALDLCLQGFMSPSTLGIDVKKLDNAEAQREKEKATLYTRNKIVNKLQEILPKLVRNVLLARDAYYKQESRETEITVSFGEYANPSFESQVETISKAKSGGIMSVEASVDELYGDTKDETWKSEEVIRLKAEQGITEMEEPQMAQMPQADDRDILESPQGGMTMLNGAQIASLMNMIGMVKAGQLTRSEAINIVTATLGVPREQAETFIENGL